MEEPKKIEQREIRVVWGNPDGIPSHYANHLQISSGGGTEFHITFGYLSPPLTFGLEEHELPEEIVVKPLLEIVASPEVMRKFVGVFESGLEMFEKRKVAEESEKKKTDTLLIRRLPVSFTGRIRQRADEFASSGTAVDPASLIQEKIISWDDLGADVVAELMIWENASSHDLGYIEGLAE